MVFFPDQMDVITSLEPNSEHHQHIIDMRTRRFINFSRNSSSSSSSSSSRGSSPLNSGLWIICVELFITLSQIIASIIVVALSRNEIMSEAQFFTWIVGYALCCVSTLPVLYWRFRNRNHIVTQELAFQASFGSIIPPLDASYAALSRHALVLDDDEEDGGGGHDTTGIAAGASNSRLNRIIVEHFKLFWDCFFGIWFMVGNLWVFVTQTSSSEASNLYRLCVVFLTFSFIGYAVPLILCAAICCCLPCIVSFLGDGDGAASSEEEFSPPRRATLSESINALPIYRFTVRRSENSDDDNADIVEGGIYAEGTDKERFISGQDAECCICLGEYGDNDELRELPCLHFFHVQCIDSWLNINPICPLCEYPLGVTSSLTGYQM